MSAHVADDPSRAPRRDWSFALYRVGALVVGALPRRMTLAIADVAGRAAAKRLPERRRVVAENLTHVVGALPTGELEALVDDAFVEYARYWTLTAWLTSPLPRRRTRPVTITGREHYVEAMRTGGVLFAVPHLGLWDAGGLVSLIEGFPIATVAEEASSPRLTRWFERQRSRLGLTSYFPGPNATTSLINLLRGGGAVALVADRDVIGDGIEVPFFGARTRVPSGPVVLALRSGATLLPSAVFLRPKGRIEVAIGAPLPLDRRGRLRDDVERLTIDLVGRYEALIRSAPEQWHVFQPIWGDAAATDRVDPVAEPA